MTDRQGDASQCDTQNANTQHAHTQYKAIAGETALVDADPHRLIEMLFSAALGKLAAARGCLQRGDIAGKGQAVGEAIALVAALDSSLDHDHDRGGEMASNLSLLYRRVILCLSDANCHNSLSALEEAVALLQPLQSAWEEIRPQSKEQSQEQPQATRSQKARSQGEYSESDQRTISADV